MPSPGDIYYALDTNKTYVTVNGQWVLQSPEFTGDVSIPQSTTVTTLATVNSSPGTYGSAITVPVITVDAKGRITGVFDTPISQPAPVAGGPSNSIQYNNGGFLDGDSTFTFDPSTSTLTFDNATVTGTMSFSNPLNTFNNLSPLTTRGDILTHDNTNNVRLPVGANGQSLVADSSQPTGLKWTTITGGGSNVPYYVPVSTTYLLPENYQANFILPIEVDGDIEIDGYLIELSNQ